MTLTTSRRLGRRRRDTQAVAPAVAPAYEPLPAVPTAASTIWIVAAQAGTCSAQERAHFAQAVNALGQADRADRLLLVTCHRAELFGIGPVSDAEALVRALAPDGLRARLELLTGGRAIRHALRLATGLESAAVGEDQILHQVRALREVARGRQTDPVLARLLETAICAGRKARSVRSGVGRSDVGLASSGLDWLAAHGPLRSGGRLLIVGSGAMGELLALEARRRGMKITVASRHESHAAALARIVSGRAVGLAEAAAVAPAHDWVAIALRGFWPEGNGVPALPPTVDLSSPPAITPSMHTPYLDIDGLQRLSATSHPTADQLAYSTSTNQVVEQTAVEFERWLTGRASVATLRSLRDSAERRREIETQLLLRRLPDLEPRERALVEEFGRRLVSALLHEPSSRLRDDVDGETAAAARRLFNL
jgi:glutamyl-tRNA reductase